jgi:protocatechuate 3,4-dioxygenase beta subunit
MTASSPRLTVVIVGAAVAFLIGTTYSPSPSLLLAQQPAASAGTAVISGVAIDGTTKTPVPGASMSLARDTSDGIRMPSRTLLADAQGRFVFTAVPEGRFRLEGRVGSASYGAYGSEGSRPKLGSASGIGLQIPLVPFNLEPRPGQRVTANVTLWRDPVLSGRVVSDRGEPVRDALVRVGQWRILGGRGSLNGTLTTTDDQGTFSVRVSPGEYLLGVTAPDDVITRNVSDTSPGEQFGYAATFYPGTTTLDAASTISVGAGDERNGLIIQMPRVRTYRVRGTLRSQNGTVPNRISIAPAGSPTDDLTGQRATAVDADGRFTFNNLAPGRYVLATLTSGIVTPGRGGAPANNTWVNASIDVRSSDIDVVADAHPGLHVTGRVMFDGTGPAPDLLSTNVTLERDAQAGEPTDFVPALPRSVEADGHFSIDVLPGRYVVQGSAGGRGVGAGWTIRSAMSGTQDLADVPFAALSDVSNVVVTFTDRTATVRGRVAGSAREPTIVVVFPADERFWSDFIVRRKRVSRPGADGTFTAEGLPAGDYYVCAVRDLNQADIRSGAYYAALAPRATRVTLAEGDSRTLDLQAMVAPSPGTLFAAPAALGREAADVAEVRSASTAARRGGSISGRVIDATTGRPIAAMRLSLAANLGESVYSDADGNFLFDSVAPGAHLIYTRHHSYVPTIYGARRPDEPGAPVNVATGQRITGLTFPITRGATITGTVVDHNGEPVSDVTLSVRQYRWQPSGRELVAVQTVTFLGAPRSDFHGRFRLVGLAPGDYIVTAGSATVSRQPVAVTTAADVAFATATPDTRMAVPEATTAMIATATYPSVFDIARGNSLRLAVGEERNITLHMNLVSGGSVSGLVHGPDGAAMSGVTVQLVSNDPLAGTAAAKFGTSDASGAFTISGVLPGAYTLTSRPVPLVRVTGQRGQGPDPATVRPDVLPPTVAALPLEVQVDGDVSGVVLSMLPTRTLGGRLRAEGSDVPPAVNAVRLTASRIGAPAGSANAPATTSWAADGTFTFTDLAPGRYRLTFTGARNTTLPRWIAQDAAGTNAIDRGIDIGAATSIRNVDLTASTTPSRFAGVIESTSRRTEGIFVVLFAAQSEAWTPPSLRVFATQPDQEGRFAFPNVPPGAYRLAPVTDAEPNQWFDPAFLATLVDRSMPVTVTRESTDGIRLALP